MVLTYSCILSKVRLGILPTRLETARYLRPALPENERLCYCQYGETECEHHLLFSCHKYGNLRAAWLTKLSKADKFLTLPPSEKFKLVLKKPENVRHTAQFVINGLRAFSIPGVTGWSPPPPFKSVVRVWFQFFFKRWEIGVQRTRNQKMSLLASKLWI